jgi:hypothetical protein
LLDEIQPERVKLLQDLPHSSRPVHGRHVVLKGSGGPSRSVVVYLGHCDGHPEVKNPGSRRPMISQLLPGFRNIRTPLATGYLYLGLLWLGVGELMPTSQSADTGAGAWLCATGRSRLSVGRLARPEYGTRLGLGERIRARRRPDDRSGRISNQSDPGDVSLPAHQWWCDIRHIYGTTEQQMRR